MDNKKILLVYYSNTGNTEKVAKDIKSKLNCDIEKIKEKNINRKGLIGFLKSGYQGKFKKKSDIIKPEYNPKDYNIVIIGCPVWGWGLCPPIRTYAEKYRNQLNNIIFFVTSAGTDSKNIVPYLEEVIEKKIHKHTGFNSVQLKDNEIYKNKLDSLIEMIK